MKMSEILELARAWAILDASTQVTTERVYVERITYRVGSSGDQINLYDGVGATGRKFNIMVGTKDVTYQLDIGLIFNNGLYFEDASGNAEVVISYITLTR